MLGTLPVVWVNHGRALAAGGYDWHRFWRVAWELTERALRIADPAGSASETRSERAPARSFG